MSASSTLRKTGSCAYRFDERGIGYPTSDELDQIRAAVEQLRKQRTGVRFVGDVENEEDCKMWIAESLAAALEVYED